MTTKAYEEVIDFLAAGRSPAEIIEFRPSEEARARVYDLVAREKGDGLSADESKELDDYMRLEHLMRLTKARARQVNGQVWARAKRRKKSDIMPATLNASTKVFTRL